ncbi:hypothetical protein MMB232_02236 [Brevundimonas subvibrioides]|uniref:hypothetical protein n=1 Tax=Brevundimonas subvibrioides TaxID=74313 RepID=UPI0032D58EC1
MTTRFRTRARRLSCALMMSSAIALVMFGQPGPAAAQDAYATFFSSGYTYCDAKMMGALYGQDADGGKVIIGQKVSNGIGSNIRVTLAESRRLGNTCEWEDTGLSYNDALVMAEVWGFDDPYDAKLKAARLYTQGRSQQVANALG